MVICEGALAMHKLSTQHESAKGESDYQMPTTWSHVPNLFRRPRTILFQEFTRPMIYDSTNSNLDRTNSSPKSSQQPWNSPRPSRNTDPKLRQHLSHRANCLPTHLPNLTSETTTDSCALMLTSTSQIPITCCPALPRAVSP